MSWIKRLFKGDAIQNRKVTKAKFLYRYVIFGSLAGLGYFIASLFMGWPWHWSLSPVYLLVGFMLFRFLLKNWKMIGTYIMDMERGKLLLYLNEHTHWEEDKKLKVIKWVYLGRNEVRKETIDALMQKVYEGGKLNKQEKKVVKKNTVFCPQQFIGENAGFNEALLVEALIYAHRNIHVLDPELRDIMKLTDDNMWKFNINNEAKKCTDKDYQKMIKKGLEIAKKQKQC